MTRIEEIEASFTNARELGDLRDPLIAHAIGYGFDLLAENKRLREALGVVANSGKFYCHDDAAWDVVNAALTPEKVKP